MWNTNWNDFSCGFFLDKQFSIWGLYKCPLVWQICVDYHVIICPFDSVFCSGSDIWKYPKGASIYNNGNENRSSNILNKKRRSIKFSYLPFLAPRGMSSQIQWRNDSWDALFPLVFNRTDVIGVKADKSGLPSVLFSLIVVGTDRNRWMDIRYCINTFLFVQNLIVAYRFYK